MGIMGVNGNLWELMGIMGVNGVAEMKSYAKLRKKNSKI